MYERLPVSQCAMTVEVGFLFPTRKISCVRPSEACSAKPDPRNALSALDTQGDPGPPGTVTYPVTRASPVRKGAVFEVTSSSPSLARTPPLRLGFCGLLVRVGERYFSQPNCVRTNTDRGPDSPRVPRVQRPLQWPRFESELRPFAECCLLSLSLYSLSCLPSPVLSNKGKKPPKYYKKKHTQTSCRQASVDVKSIFRYRQETQE